jgi:hypothetical protein
MVRSPDEQEQNNAGYKSVKRPRPLLFMNTSATRVSDQRSEPGDVQGFDFESPIPQVAEQYSLEFLPSNMWPADTKIHWGRLQYWHAKFTRKIRKPKHYAPDLMNHNRWVQFVRLNCRDTVR